MNAPNPATPSTGKGPMIALGCAAVVAALIGIALFSAYSDATKEKQMPAAQHQRVRAAAMAEIDSYTSTLGRVYQTLSTWKPDDFRKASCVVKPAAAGAPLAFSLYGPYMQRFLHRDESWRADDSPWSFITDRTFADHFDKNPKDESEAVLRDTAQHVKETFLSPRYVVVLWPDPSANNRVPRRTAAQLASTLRAGEQFDRGEFHGWVAIADQTEGTIACVRRIDAESSDTIAHAHNEPFGSPLHTRMVVYHGEDDAAKEIRGNFERNLKHEIEMNLPAGVTADLRFGSIF